MPHAAPAARKAVRWIDNVRPVLKKAWSIWVAWAGIVFWGVVSGLWILWPAFVERLPFRIAFQRSWSSSNSMDTGPRSPLKPP